MGQVMTREHLLQTIWGYDYFGDVRTVDVTIRRLREERLKMIRHILNILWRVEALDISSNNMSRGRNEWSG